MGLLLIKTSSGRLSVRLVGIEYTGGEGDGREMRSLDLHRLDGIAHWIEEDEEKITPSVGEATE